MDNSASLDIRGFIDDRSMSNYQWLLVFLCFMIVAIDGMDVAIMGFVAPAITSDWHISKPAFGFVMGAAPIGLALGALIAGSSSDWFGRRKVLIASVFGFGVCSIFTAYANTPEHMAILRLLTGLGLGAAMPNATTLLTEYVPARSRSLIVATMFTGFNLGSALIGFVAAYLLPRHGWNAVLLFGGMLPLLMVPVLYSLLPESARYMAVKGHAMDKIKRVLSKVCSTHLEAHTSFHLSEEAVPSKMPLKVLFSSAYAARTITLWVTYFMGLLVIYLSTGWLPTMMKDAGIPIERAAEITAMFQLGGTVGAIIVGYAMDRFKPGKVISFAYLIGAVALLALGAGGVLSPMITLLVCLVGFFMSGAQTGINAFAPSCYPTVARATGTSWMLGVGRMGSILGSSIGGLLLSLGWGFEPIFMLLAIPAVIAAIAIRYNTQTPE